MSDQNPPRVLGQINPSIFDDLLVLPSGQTVSEIKAIARSVVKANPKIKLTHAVTTLLNGAGLAVRDISQAYPVMLGDAFNVDRVDAINAYIAPNGEDSVWLGPKEGQGIQISFGSHISLKSNPPRELTDAERIAKIESRLRSHIEMSPQHDPNARDKYKAALEKLVKATVHGGSGSRAAAQILLSLYNGSDWQMDLTDLRLLDPESREAAITALKFDAQVNEEPHTVLDDGNAIYDRLKHAWPTLYNPIRHHDDCLDNIVEYWKCPECNQGLERPQYPDWIMNDDLIPTCCGDADHDEVEMYVAARYRLTQAKIEQL